MQPPANQCRAISVTTFSELGALCVFAGLIFCRSANQIFRAKTQSSPREEFLPDRETAIGQNAQLSREVCFCLSLSPDKQKE